MKKIINTPLAILLCMAMAVVFTACEPEEDVKINQTEKDLTFLCNEDTITNGSTYTSTKLDDTYLALGIARFVPGIDLVGNKDGKITVVVKSLNETMIEICTFGGCQFTDSEEGYTTDVSGNITANTPLPLEIHHTAASPDEVHRARALITAYYEGEEDNAVSFTLVMTNAQ